MRLRYGVSQAVLKDEQSETIIDPLVRQVAVLIRQRGGVDATRTERDFGDADRIESSRLPGLAPTVVDLWAGFQVESRTSGF